MSDEWPISSSYRSTSTRDPIWTRVADDPNDRRIVQHENNAVGSMQFYKIL